jgi:hypothetical protein
LKSRSVFVFTLYCGNLVCESETMGERIGEYKILVYITEGRRPHRKPRRRYEDNIKVDFQEVGQGGMGWVALVEDRDFVGRL